MTPPVRRIVLTRARATGASWARALQDALGLVVNEWSCIEQRLRPASARELAALQEVLNCPAATTWIVCTSAFGATGLRAWLDAARLELNRSFRAAAVGPASAAAMTRTLGLRPQIAKPHSARGLETLLVRQLAPASLVILPISTLAHPGLEAALVKAGCATLALRVYETLPFQAAPDAPKEPVPWSDDASATRVVLASPSAVTGFVTRLAGRQAPPVLALGPTTYAAAKAQLATSVAMAPEASLAGVLAWFRQQRAC